MPIHDWTRVVMSDLKSPTLIWIKGVLFLILGLFAAALLLLRSPSLTIAVLLVISIWSFCRFYYFAFYVIEHYVDNEYSYSGLFQFVKYAALRRRVKQEKGRWMTQARDGQETY